MKKLYFTAYLLVVTLLFISCKKDETGPDYTHWPVVEINGATQAAVGQTVQLIVSWPYSSGCDVMDKFNTKKEGNLYTITALGYYNNTICTQDAGIKTKEYFFAASVAGTYQLDFVNPDSSIITHNIIVQ